NATSSSAASSPSDTANRSALAASYLNSPLAFEPNRGQAGAGLQYLARGPGYQIFLTSGKALLRAASGRRGADSGQQLQSLVQIRFAGANEPAGAAVSDIQPGHSNYFLGQREITDLPLYGRVRYRQLYPGVDLVYYGKQGSLEYDLELAP